MRDGYYVNAHGEKVVQKMVNENDEPKGMKAVLEERGFDTSNLNRETMRELLSAQPDFKGQKCFLEVCTHGIVTAHTATLIFPAQELLERRGHRCVFFPQVPLRTIARRDGVGLCQTLLPQQLQV